MAGSWCSRSGYICGSHVLLELSNFVRCNFTNGQWNSYYGTYRPFSPDNCGRICWDFFITCLFDGSRFGFNPYFCRIVPLDDGSSRSYTLREREEVIMFEPLDPLLHSELRLAVISILISVEEADFVYLREKTGATAGNLSVQISKLNEAGYIKLERGFVGKRTRTVCKITSKGVDAFEKYVDALKTYLDPRD